LLQHFGAINFVADCGASGKLIQCPTPARFAGKSFVSLSPFRAKAVYPKCTSLLATGAGR
jgi:hypothetical protein